MILETIDADVRELKLLIKYHISIFANARLYNRPSEEALEEFTVKYLQELKEIREKEIS